MAAKGKPEGWWSKYGVTLMTVFVTAILTAGGTLIVSDYVDFASSNREQIAEQRKAVEDTAKQVTALVQKFSDKAIGQGQTTDDDYNELKTLLLRLTEETRTLSDQLPSTQSIYVKYVDAMIDLRNAAGQLTGPLDGKVFKQAVINYYTQQFAFNDAVINAQQHYTFPTIWPDATTKIASPSA